MSIINSHHRTCKSFIRILVWLSDVSDGLNELLNGGIFVRVVYHIKWSGYSGDGVEENARVQTAVELSTGSSTPVVSSPDGRHLVCCAVYRNVLGINDVLMSGTQEGSELNRRWLLSSTCERSM